MSLEEKKVEHSVLMNTYTDEIISTQAATDARKLELTTSVPVATYVPIIERTVLLQLPYWLGLRFIYVFVYTEYIF